MSEALEKLIRTDASAEAGYDLGVEEERAAVVKYLRDKADGCADGFWRNMINLWASKIEKGEHK